MDHSSFKARKISGLDPFHGRAIVCIGNWSSVLKEFDRVRQPPIRSQTPIIQLAPMHSGFADVTVLLL